MAGCQSQPGAPTAPLLTADRVPPPATRIPGGAAAAPYYPATPAPALPAGVQSAPPAPVEQVVATPPTVNRLPSTGVAITLPADNQPLRLASATQAAPTATIAAPTADAPPVITSPPFTPPQAPQQLAWSGSAPVAEPQRLTPFNTAGGSPPPVATPALAATAPRVRLPGYATPVAYLAAAPNGTAAGMAPQAQQAATAAAPPAAADGFRPRGASTGRHW